MTSPGSSRTFAVYIATRYADARRAHEDVRPALEAAGARVISRWHDPPHAGAEDLDAMSASDRLEVLLANRDALRMADVVLVLADRDGGRETFAEVEDALNKGRLVIYVGRPTLSVAVARDLGRAVVVEDANAAVAGLAIFARGLLAS